MKETVYIEGKEDLNRPQERPPKTNWKIEVIKKGLSVLQHASPKKSAEIIWHYFTMPGRTKFSEPQKTLLERAEVIESNYQGDTIKAYRWSTGTKKILLVHGWRSKAADFRRMIETLLQEGYTVESIDMRAHGNSGGKHTALPEFRDILKSHYTKHGPFHGVVGYSLGALASGIALSELSQAFQPKHLILIAGPPFVRYFFKDLINDIGCNDAVYKAMSNQVEVNYHQNIDYFDLRTKATELEAIEKHLIYCENDSMIPFEKGQELEQKFQDASFVHAKGLGHYKIIANPSIIDYVKSSLGK